jgi:hypothetical protein
LVTVTAVFKAIRFSIKTSIGPGGNTFPSGNVKVDSGHDQNFTFTPQSGYIMDTLTIDGIPVIPPVGKYSLTNISDGHSINATFASANTTILDLQIGSGTDDGTFFWNGSTWDQDSLDFAGLYVGYVNNADYKEGVALRWASLAVPSGAIVSNCSLLVCANDSLGTSTVNSKITGDKEQNAAGLSDLANYQSRRGVLVGGNNNNKITAAQVAWNNIKPWKGDLWYSSPDISSIIQEIINQPDWQSGNSLALFWDDHEGLSTSVNGKYRGIYAYDDVPAKAARLHVEYTLSSSSSH